MYRYSLKKLLKWALWKCYIEIHVHSDAEVQMNRDDFDTIYYGETLYEALKTAYIAEQALMKDPE